MLVVVDIHKKNMLVVVDIHKQTNACRSRYTQTNKYLMEYTWIPGALLPLKNLQKVGIMKPLLRSSIAIL